MLVHCTMSQIAIQIPNSLISQNQSYICEKCWYLFNDSFEYCLGCRLYRVMLPLWRHCQIRISHKQKCVCPMWLPSIWTWHPRHCQIALQCVRYTLTAKWVTVRHEYGNLGQSFKEVVYLVICFFINDWFNIVYLTMTEPHKRI